MHYTTLLLSTALAIAPAGVLGWAQAANGVWVVSNTWYPRVGNYNNVHESCTRMNSNIVLTSGDCAYWKDGNGNIGHTATDEHMWPSDCAQKDNKVACWPGCPDPFSPCQYANEEGGCDYGYAACLQKMGCDGRAGGADCIGTATVFLSLSKGFVLFGD
ncbi:hypothetical protein B0T25DRAFT_604912 [Lasiosphaeria hispida]|uniref:Uncharacterized protein n=1 Tax=Lasiosphaeria hispida TaxID=260671 RepID=A0AAJ0MGI7_9PEZI|nr:hypothetical protein B0T25DRAFT_604912 [Lasiosphaeria hispida]